MNGRARYSLATEWLIAAPVERVFDALAEPRAWPQWWRYVKSVQSVAPGDANGVGAVWRYTWSSRLPYRLAFDMTTTAAHRPDRIEGSASGELTGVGRWRLSELPSALRASGPIRAWGGPARSWREGDASRVRYDWIVTTTKRWMQVWSPLLAPLFAWNHDQVMAAGARGLASHLGVPLLAYHRLRHDEDRACTTC